MDNSATSYPKPDSVYKEVKHSMKKYYANAGRGSSKASLDSAELVFDARSALATLVGTTPENIVFTYNATYALNMVLLGTIRSGMRVAYDAFAHNSVLRPLYALEKQGVIISKLDTDLERDSVIISSFERLVNTQKPDVLVLTHTSNVTGKKLPIKRLSEICKKHDILLIVDGSQGIGSSDIKLDELGIDILASSGHKGLYGIMGTGFIAFRECYTADILPVITGGSGILSKEREMPMLLPERLEAGTLGIPGIASMKAGAEYILKHTASAIANSERRLRARLLEGLGVTRGVRVYNADVNAVSIVLFNVKGVPSERVAELLDREGIAVRAGYHCAPEAHALLAKKYGDTDGAVRLSVGHFNTERECDRVLGAISAIAKENFN